MAVRNNAVLHPPPPPASSNSRAPAFVESSEHMEGAPVVPIHRISRMPTTPVESQLRDMFEQMQAAIGTQTTDGAAQLASGSLGANSNLPYEKVLQQLTPPAYTRQIETEGTVLSDTVDHDGRPITLEVLHRVDHRFLLREPGHSYTLGPHEDYDVESSSKYSLIGSPKVVHDVKFPTTVASFKGVTWVGATHSESPGAWQRARGKAIRNGAKRDRTRRRLGRRQVTWQDFIFGNGVLRRPPSVYWFCRNPDGKSPFLGDETPWPLGTVADATYDDALWGKIARLKTSAMKRFKASPFVYEPVVSFSVTGTRTYERKRVLHPDLKAQFDSIEAEVLKNEAGGDLPWDPAPSDASPSQDEGVSSTDSPSWEVDEDLVSKAVALGIIDWGDVPNPYEVSEQFISDWASGLSFKVRGREYARQVIEAGRPLSHEVDPKFKCPVGTELSAAGATDGREAANDGEHSETDYSGVWKTWPTVTVPSGLVGAVRKGTVEVLTRNAVLRARGKDEDPLLLPAGESVIDLPPSEYRVLSREEAADHDLHEDNTEPTEKEIRRFLLHGPEYERVRAAIRHLSRVERNIKPRKYLGFSRVEADPIGESFTRLIAQRSQQHTISMYLKGYAKNPEGTPLLVPAPNSGPGPTHNQTLNETASERIEHVLTMDLGKGVARLARRVMRAVRGEESRFSAADALRIRRKYGIVPQRGYLRHLERVRSLGLELHSSPTKPHYPVLRSQLEVALARWSGTGVTRRKGTNERHIPLVIEQAARLTDEEFERRFLEVTTPTLAPPDWQLKLEQAKGFKALVAERSLSLAATLDPVEVRAHARMVMPYIASIRPQVGEPPSKGEVKKGPGGTPVL